MYLQEFTNSQCHTISVSARSRKRCIKNSFTNYIHNAAIVYILLIFLPARSFGWSVPFFGNIFSTQDQSNVQQYGFKPATDPSLTPSINEKETGFHPNIVLTVG